MWRSRFVQCSQIHVPCEAEDTSSAHALNDQERDLKRSRNCPRRCTDAAMTICGSQKVICTCHGVLEQFTFVLFSIAERPLQAPSVVIEQRGYQYPSLANAIILCSFLPSFPLTPSLLVSQYLTPGHAPVLDNISSIHLVVGSNGNARSTGPKRQKAAKDVRTEKSTCIHLPSSAAIESYSTKTWRPRCPRLELRMTAAASAVRWVPPPPPPPNLNCPSEISRRLGCDETIGPW